MSELIISGSSGGFLRNIGKEYQEAAENFMRFMNDQGLCAEYSARPPVGVSFMGALVSRSPACLVSDLTRNGPRVFSSAA